MESTEGGRTEGGGAEGGRAEHGGAEGGRAEPGARGRLLGLAVMAVVVAAAALAVYGDRHTFATAIHRVGVPAAIAAFGAGVAGVATTFPVWRQVVAGLGVDMAGGDAARVYFTSQLGKYLPGAVWPILLQVEAGRRHGAARRTMLSAGALSLVIGCSSGLLVASVLLPLSDVHALSKYWFTVFAVPVLLALLHPRALPLVLDRLLGLLHRPPMHVRLSGAHELRAFGWSLLGWVGLGGQLAVLCAALGRGGASTFLLCIGAMGLAIPLGVLFIPAPAGAGVREVVLTLTLGAVLRPGEALVVVVVSRALLVGADVMLAAVATAVTPRRSRAPSAA